MNIDIYAFSGSGAKLCDKIIETLNEYTIEAFVPERYVSFAKHVKVRKDNLYKSTEKSFKDKDCIIFIGAAGIAVRAIAPFVTSKTTDPAVICMDEKGINVISLLSGHIGGANKLTLKIADAVGGSPIITTATDINDKFAVDEWAVNNNMHILNLKSARNISADILENKKIGIYSDFDIISELPKELDVNEKAAGICISLNSYKKPFHNTLYLIPKIVSVGIGCRKGTSFEEIYDAINQVLIKNNISHFAIKSLNSIDLKKQEKGIIKTSEIYKVPFNTYTRDELNCVQGQFSQSSFVKSVTGVDNVCERAAVMASNSNKLIIKKSIVNSVTVAATIDDYTVNFNQEE